MLWFVWLKTKYKVGVKIGTVTFTDLFTRPDLEGIAPRGMRGRVGVRVRDLLQLTLGYCNLAICCDTSHAKFRVVGHVNPRRIRADPRPIPREGGSPVIFVGLPGPRRLAAN